MHACVFCRCERCCFISHFSDSVQIKEGDETLNKTRFETTKRMSTYLLAFIVSDFIAVEKMEGDISVITIFFTSFRFILRITLALSWISRISVSLAAQIRIFAREQAIKAGHGDYALNITGRILKFFESYYNVPYPLPKSGRRLTLGSWDKAAMCLFISLSGHEIYKLLCLYLQLIINAQYIIYNAQKCIINTNKPNLNQ